MGMIQAGREYLTSLADKEKRVLWPLENIVVGGFPPEGFVSHSFVGGSETTRSSTISEDGIIDSQNRKAFPE